MHPKEIECDAVDRILWYPVVSSCDQVPIKGSEFLEQLSDCHLFRKDFDLWG
jgi:hypothetical protein